MEFAELVDEMHGFVSESALRDVGFFPVRHVLETDFFFAEGVVFEWKGAFFVVYFGGEDIMEAELAREDVLHDVDCLALVF